MTEQTDITRWNRNERRKFTKRTKLKLPGRNLPFIKREHSTLENFYRLREEETKQDESSRKTNSNDT